ncbi:MAG: hypothetical protein LWX56_11970, partial [Ignavibacteria bacterium]|nr:hypothetical protein [Ignavibacteria bacterium]
MLKQIWILIICTTITGLAQSPSYNLLLKFNSGVNDINIPVDTIDGISFQNYSGILRVRNIDTTKNLAIPAAAIDTISFSTMLYPSMVVHYKNPAGNITIALDSILELTLQKPDGVKENGKKMLEINGYELMQNYPNPFNPVT